MNYSKQRQTIYEYVKSTKTHPTADSIYNYLKKENPNLSLATVYRNLNQMSEDKKFRRLNFSGLPDRFDGNVDEHYHMVCNKCNSVYDIMLNSFKNIDNEIEEKTGFKILSHDIMFEGICDKCKMLN